MRTQASNAPNCEVTKHADRDGRTGASLQVNIRQTIIRTFVCGVLVSLLLVVGSSASAQEDEQSIWEYDPYQVRVWIAIDRIAVLPKGYVDRLNQRVMWSSEQIDLSSWTVTSTAAPAVWRQKMLQSIDGLSLPEDEEETKELLTGDKLIFISIKHDGMHFRVSGRELDCRTRVWGPVIQLQTSDKTMLPHVVFQTMSKAFVPLVRIEDVNVDRGTAVVRVRAGGFHQNRGIGTEQSDDKLSPIWVNEDDILLPMIRRKDKAGSGIRIVDWTYLTITSRDGVLLNCDIHSASNAPMGGRSSRRVEKLALVVRPQRTQTRVFLVSRDDPPIPLPGYDVIRKLPGASESEPVGKTDWRGSILVERDESSPLQLFYVKSGSRTMARLPVVAGLHKELTAPMYNDSVRRRAEGVMRGLETEFMILVAKRELLDARIRSRLAQDDLKDAENLYNELRSLPTLEEFQAKVDAQERMLDTNDRRERDKISSMFNQLRRLSLVHLSEDISTPLRQEIDRYAPTNSSDASDEAPAQESQGFGSN